jgi:hypothetical protein
MVARENVSEDLLVRMADMRRRVGIIDRGADVETLGHVGCRGCGSRKARATALALDEQPLQ